MNSSPLLNQQKSYKELKQALHQQGRLGFWILSDSMQPLIKTKELIEIIPPQHPLKPFDIIVFYQNDNMVCHYIWHLNYLSDHLESQIYVTRSLKYHQEDLPISSHAVLGVVISHRFSLYLKIWLYFQAALKRWVLG